MSRGLALKLIILVGVIVFAGVVYWTFEPVLRDDGSAFVPHPEALDTPNGTSGPADPVLVGAGDISSCENDGDETTARLLDQVVASATSETLVFTAGDNAYENGTLQEYEQCFGPTWGRHKDRIRPALGNHEYGLEDNALGYFAYFGQVAGDPDKGYYSFDLGTWHIVVLNTSDHCGIVPCDETSEQALWLRADLEAHPTFCTLAIHQDPRFSSSARNGGHVAVRPFWEALYEFGADLVVSGDEHNFERFALQTPFGGLDPQYGIRQFVVGTGGNELDRFDDPPGPNSEVRSDTNYGVIKLTLHPSGYDWEFLPEEGGQFRDSGSAECHGAPRRALD